MQRLWDAVAAMVPPAQARVLEALLEVPDGISDLERLRTGPTTVSGKAMVAALDRVAELAALGLGCLDLDAVPHRRVVELARWGMAGKAPALRRHRSSRRLATLAATVVYLEARAIDDALELFGEGLPGRDRPAPHSPDSNEERTRKMPPPDLPCGCPAAA